MQVKIQLTGEKKVILPTGFNEYIQAIVYKFLDNVSGDWLHDTGYKFEKRDFKLFTFSTILEKGGFNKSKKIFVFPETVSFILSSPVQWILEQVAANTMKSEKVFLGKNKMQVSSIEVKKDEVIDSSKIKVKTLSPIEIHSTFVNGEGKKKTYYYNPKEEEFSSYINKNLKKKWYALYQKECEYDLKIYPVDPKKIKERVMYSNDIVVKGWNGWFWLEGDKELIRFALDAGLGSRNSSGFGCVERVKEKR